MWSVIPWKAVSIGAGAALLAAMLWAGVEHWQGNRATARAVAAESRVAVLAEANVTQTSTIASLRDAVAKWEKLATPERPELAGQADVFKAEILKLKADRERAERAEREKPKCADLLRQDFAGACPAIAGGLQERAAGRPD